ncbi:hypothetical protein BD779DRAFT_1470423 [Infundibulicybe gibba]|nr:hypothetical protein BD779DRAFT_1470423 [Infundibulicybe gibba]
MKTFTFTQLALFASVCMSSLANASPTVQEPRDVFTPQVLDPHAGTVWLVGQRQNVTWDTSKAPVNITNKIGRILLRKGGLTTPLILADGFSILLGKIEVTVPWVLDGDDYQVNLFGDSGDFSDFFTIQSNVIMGSPL